MHGSCCTNTTGGSRKGTVWKNTYRYFCGDESWFNPVKKLNRNQLKFKMASGARTLFLLNGIGEFIAGALFAVLPDIFGFREQPIDDTSRFLFT